MRRTRVGLALATAVTMTLPWWLAQPAQAAPAGPSIVQIVAHEDDDLLFMNPDLLNSIRAGVPITSIYLTAGENTAALRGSTPLLDYAKGRQAGIKLAYAQMANVPCSTDTACWTPEEYSVPGTGHVVEHYTLNGHSNIQLYFLNLPDGGDVDSGFVPNALRQLWNGSSLSADTLTVSNSGNWPQHYSRADVLAVLTGLLSQSQASLVRVQDPAPDPLLLGELPLPEHDNQDHISAAWFADAAVGQYASQQPRVVLDHYRDYNIQDTPANLSGVQTGEKHGTFEGVYAPHDPLVTWEIRGTDCVPSSVYYKCWESREQSRMPRSTQSVTSDASGALHAFAVEGGSLYEWAEDANKVWQGPFAHGNPAGPLAAGVSVGRNQDGRLEVFGQRADTGEIISNFQSTAGGWAWGAYGNPNLSDPSPLKNDALQVSAPVVASNGDGRLQIFVRNRGGGISSRWQTTVNGNWVDSWTDMGGNGIQETPTAFTNRDGRIELFAWAPSSFGSSVLHWFQPAPNQPFQRDTNFPAVAPTSAVSVGMDQDGRLELLYRQLDGQEPLTQTANSYTMTAYQTSTGGTWAPAAGALGGGPDQGGIGAPAVVTTGDGRIVTAVRNRVGGISVSRQTAPNSPFGGWTDLGGPGNGLITGVPASAVDRNGLADLVAIGLDGRLYDNRQRTDGSFGGWTAMGSS